MAQEGLLQRERTREAPAEKRLQRRARPSQQPEPKSIARYHG